MKIAQMLDGALTWIEREVEDAGAALEADLVLARSWIEPDIEAKAHNLASKLESDGLALLEQVALAALMTPGTPAEKADTALKMTLVGLKGMGKDVETVSGEALTQAIATIQAHAGVPADPQPAAEAQPQP